MLIDYASALRAGQALVPDLNQVEAIRAETDAKKMAITKAKADMAIALRNQQREEDFMFEATEAFRDPNAQRIASLQARYPDHYKALQSGWETIDKEQRETQLTRMGSVYARIRAKDLEGAAALIREDIEADRAAGNIDQNDIWALEAIESGDPERIANVGGALTILLAIGAGPDKFGATWGSIREEERQQDEHPAKVAKGVSESEIAAAEAGAAPAYYASRAEHEAAEADIAESDARFRDQSNASMIAGRNARTAATQSREDRMVARAAERPAARTRPSARDKYAEYATNAAGVRLGYNRKTRKWERVR
ncbi:hypothetical protein AAJ72_09965 [Citromicrobium sp. RCC1885]|uniref:hypothetical protein n=1 Tax=unclassified Citromicrobium TaxID=2630544 RepID=UPI0006C92DB9|nr:MULTISPECIES: hypothetical protein [unclassified Citromicrobium]KPM23221.1 hypothetical protein AAJ72_09965 [Citromicrobium sp. RCC1885]KPM26628.1 hypothetical protein AAJ74_10705 [Citromicrobium sp. RCC1878]OAM08855.1 hypothetical protein A0U43_09600 [Citromicrobium sp. RCC1897]|tara:strand:- start:1815 stop:2744 length:930 start_codon:yes stop_codon:yes gene_type:complete